MTCGAVPAGTALQLLNCVTFPLFHALRINERIRNENLTPASVLLVWASAHLKTEEVVP